MKKRKCINGIYHCWKPKEPEINGAAFWNFAIILIAISFCLGIGTSLLGIGI